MSSSDSDEEEEKSDGSQKEKPKKRENGKVTKNIKKDKQVIKKSSSKPSNSRAKKS